MALRLIPATVLFAVAVLLGGRAVSAHHSTAGLFDERRSVALTGVLTGFRFAEPHGLMSVEIKNRQGYNEVWSAETNGPTLVVRGTWLKDALKVGEAVTVEGFPAQGGVKRLRLRKITRADGTVIHSAPPQARTRPADR
jgi:hypothetical protein